MYVSYASTGSEKAGERGLLATVASEAVAAAPRELETLNVGAGTSAKFERSLWHSHRNIRVDRVDVVDATVEHPAVRSTWRCSVESMPMVADSTYDVVFANYVLEHVSDLSAAFLELSRVLRPGGCFVATVPNPIAPEFLVARFTPTTLHRRFDTDAFPTHYSFRSIAALIGLARRSGLETAQLLYSPDVAFYLDGSIPRLAPLGRAYDRVALKLRSRLLLGQCLVSMRKPP